MKKLLSLLAILGLAGFVIAPIYAQEEEAVALDEAPIVAEAEDIAAEDVAVAEDSMDVEAFDEEHATDLGEIDSFNDIFENEEVRAALDETGLTNEEAA